jgi:predicted lipoprotein with Yx(FWY)xxD motif
VIRASRAAYLVCGVLTALALAGWGVRAAGTPRNDVARNSSVPVANAPAQNGQNQDANNGGNTDAANGNTGTPDDVNGGQQAGGQQQDAAPPNTVLTTTLTARTIDKMGQVVSGDEGKVLYRFDKDGKNPQKSACSAAACQQVWPALVVKKGTKPQVNGIDESLVSTISHDENTDQVMLGGWLLYSYIGDTDNNTWKGQKVKNTWFVSDAKGAKNLTCVPKGIPEGVQPPAAGGNAGGNAPANPNTGNNNGGGNNGGGGYSY